MRSLSLPELRSNSSWRVSERPFSLTAAAFSADASSLAVGECTGCVQLWKTNRRVERAWSADRIKVTALGWSPDQRVLGVGMEDGSVTLWDTADGNRLQRWPAFPLSVDSILFDPDGRHVAAGSSNEPLRLWEVLTGRLVLTGLATPWSFARDGRSLAIGSASHVSFDDLVIPKVFRHLSGHRGRVERLAWSANGRHIVSLDNRFEARTWDAVMGVQIDEFRAPPGGYFATNAAVALSDDGRQLGYASGGPDRSHVLIREVASGRPLAEWELPGGYERMAFVEGGFVLVREERDESFRAEQPPQRTVAWKLGVGKTPRVLRVVRPAESRDDKGFLSSSLTQDGRLYLWVGPREPIARRRVELREVATGRLVRRVPAPSQSPSQEPGALLDPQGRNFQVNFESGEKTVFDYSDPDRPGKAISFTTWGSSPDNRWLATREPIQPADPTPVLGLRRQGDHILWLHFTNDDLSGPLEVHFSPDGRFLVWGSQDGAISVADLTVLERDVNDFEAALLGP